MVVMNMMRVNTVKRLEPAWRIGGTVAVSGDGQDAYLAFLWGSPILTSFLKNVIYF